ncbi:hypothetical protein [Chromobacterium vaccinii]|uniref:hypothetical protein n=1 Tax=Chromobacterium vaccinii TaxID=1108595 RepID=UPI000E142F2B|nr:hypothetical protein [Chromobacterium vaccinii]SUX30569.1 Uncharacterised protein [Chromobacterium vaccinii]
MLYRNARGSVVDPDALIGCAAYGGPDRSSDPTIGGTVNQLARLGFYVTLRNPVGLYMDHIDHAGWTTPDGSPAEDCVRITRGVTGMIERLEVQVPADRNFTVSDLRIGGEPVVYGGQIAECITVHLVGVAGVQGHFRNPQLECVGRCCIDPNNATLLNRSIQYPAPSPVGTVAAFVDEGTIPADGSTQALLGAGRR